MWLCRFFFVINSNFQIKKSAWHASSAFVCIYTYLYNIFVCIIVYAPAQPSRSHNTHTHTHTHAWVRESERQRVCTYIYVYISTFMLKINTSTVEIKLQVIFHKRATNYGALLRKMTFRDKVSYGSSPPCIYIHILTSNKYVYQWTNELWVCACVSVCVSEWEGERESVCTYIYICQRKQHHSLKLGKKRWESSKRNYYIISPRVIIKAIIIIIYVCQSTYELCNLPWRV